MRRLLIVTVLGACTLGGTGKPPGGGGDATGVDNAQCAAAMTNAPLAPAGFDYHDAVATATRNTWDATTMPQPGDAAYPGGRYRTVTPDGAGAIHPGCTTDGLAYTPANIPGYRCAARQFEFPPGVTEDTSKPIVILVHGNSDSPNGWMKFLHSEPELADVPGGHHRARPARRDPARAGLPDDRDRHAHR